ncbi:hypothetical protein BC629DRAFT_1459377 [Irpex lacteus]|nr:hypothetical protein BC629DRAFT_1459377 [Irpex lacteus]
MPATSEVGHCKFEDGHFGVLIPEDAPEYPPGYDEINGERDIDGLTIFILPFKGFHAYPPDEHGRTRYVRHQWPRHPQGKLLPSPGPRGKRAPNNQPVWGHDLDEFFWIQRHPDIKNILSHSITVWTRSMIKEWGENYHEDAWKLEYHDSSPHFRKPWPVLRLRIPDGEHIGDYVFDKQIGAFNLIFQACPINLTIEFTTRSDPYVEVEESSAAESTAQSSDESSGTHDIYRSLLPSSKRKTLHHYEAHKQNHYKRQGRTVEFRGAFRASYDYKPYSTPEPSVHAPRDSPFSVEDVPKLQETLPPAFMPDYLLVHDPHAVTRNDGRNKTKSELSSISTPPCKYRRIFPKIDKSALDVPPAAKAHDMVAHLYLHQKNRLGVGHHSLVYRAPLTLPPPLSASSRNGQVTVTAKLALFNTDDWDMLKHEAEIYNRFPKHLSEDWCGYIRINPIKHPVPIGPVVPKFYGYYEPVGDDDKKRWSPVLLLEECGRPIEAKDLNSDQR